MQRENIKVEKRTLVGKKVKKLRREGILPANIYGRAFTSTAVQLPLKEFVSLFKKVRETGLIDVQLNGKTIPALIHNVQIDPRTQLPTHADFYKVNLKEKIKASIPVVTIGEAGAVVEKKGVLLQLLSELEVEALPTDLPEKVEVNVEELKEINDQISISQITLPKEVTVLNESAQTVFRIGELVTKEAEEQAEKEAEAAAAATTEETPSPQEGTKEETQTTQPPSESQEKEPSK